jgi:hypothetical protein
VDGTATGIHAVALTGAFFSPSPVWGPPAKYLYERTVAGAVSSDLYSRIVAAIRRTLKSHGRFAERDGGLDWSSELEIVHISFEVHDDETSISIVGDASWDLIATYGVVGLIVAIVIGAAWFQSADGVGVLFPVLMVLGAYIVARVIWRSLARRFRNKLTSLADFLERGLVDVLSDSS